VRLTAKGRRHERDHGRHRQVQDQRPAVPGTLRRRGLRRPSARQDASLAPLQARPSIAERVIALTFATPPGETPHWMRVAMAEAADVSVSSVQRIWRAHGLQPHRIRQFRLSKDPEFVGKLRDVVGLYVDPPAHAVVLSVDEKSQIQALDRTQPGLPMKKGRAGTMTHDYKRRGTTTLFAAMNVLDGTVIGRNMQRHRHQEFIRFLNAMEREVPAGKTSTPSSTITLLISIPSCANGWRATRDGPSTSRRPRPPGSTPLRVSSQPPPNPASNAESSDPSPTSKPINRFLDNHNAPSKPFEWLADPNKIIPAVKPGLQSTSRNLDPPALFNTAMPDLDLHLPPLRTGAEMARGSESASFNLHSKTTTCCRIAP
jgi:hypothetical protein